MAHLGAFSTYIGWQFDGNGGGLAEQRCRLENSDLLFLVRFNPLHGDALYEYAIAVIRMPC